MAGDMTQIEYEKMGQVGTQAGELQQRAQQMYSKLNSQLDVLKGGKWVGDNASKFYQSMESDTLPAIQRLIEALGDMSEVAQQIIRIFDEAEDQAGNAFPTS